ncbi:MAG TPA: haloacid dehalogenase-like hydrolase [Candidatus Eisenbacteria bacterium]|nr:haloacid dehalogenase-like hydrolase [Candidatus Eisenbacteria bacterium]
MNQPPASALPRAAGPAAAAGPPAPAASVAWLFDVDGTLLLTGGASREAFAAALAERCGIADDLATIAFAGRTEPLILADVLARHGLVFDAEEEARFWQAVFAHMRRLLVPGRGGLLPGVTELLRTVAAEPRWAAGLLTGNMSEMARIKLGHYSLAGYFAFGAFGEQAPDRDALACGAVARIERTLGVPAARCVVVGDTEHDVACARAAGARVVAVASGGVPRERLARSAPDLLLDSLEQRDTLLAWVRALEG